MKYLIKNMFIKIKNSWGRFLSIALIIALGISIFLGLYESTNGLLYSADKYYDDQLLSDFKITSTHGFTKDDINEIKSLKHIGKIKPTYTLDILHKGSSIRLHANELDINKAYLLKGRMPKNKNECLGDFDYFKLNEIINIKKQKHVNKTSCKVVGLISSPLYLREDKGISNVGNGKLESYLYVDKSIFDMDYYTDVYILGDNTLDKNSYYEDYESEINLIKDELMTIKEIRETIRYEEIKKEATEQINDIEKDLTTKIIDAKKKLKKEHNLLIEAQKNIETQENESIKKIEENMSSLRINLDKIKNSIKALGLNESSLIETIRGLEEAISILNLKLLQYDESSNEYNAIKKELKKYEEERTSLNNIKNNLNEVNKNLNNLTGQLNSTKTAFKIEKDKINKGFTEYNNALNKIQNEELTLKNEIEAEQDKINNMEKPKWYLLDRSDQAGYTSYKEDIIKVESISKLLPVFFMLVVGLMILNTLTRLIEEERTEIGILLSIGFSKINIIINYLFYIFISGFIGISLGFTIGYAFIPKIIYSVFLNRYYLPKFITVVSPLPFSLVLIVTILLISIITIVSILQDLKETPASLLRPKTPKVGKKIFLENMTLIWNKLNFMNKTSLRNLFRFKKRIVMTTIGIAGSTALLIAGLGINDSVKELSKLQYENIIKYDSLLILNKEINKISNEHKKLFKDNGIKDYLMVNQNNYTFNFENKKEDVFVIASNESINNFVSLKNMYTKKEIKLNNEGAIITKQFSELLKLKSGDLFNIRNNDNEIFYLYVYDIVDNYVGHYIYLNEHYYKKIFNKEIMYNAYLTKNTFDKSVKLTDYNILMANNTKDISNQFKLFITSLNKIIILIIALAAGLGFLVLYNLTSINLAERKREVATFKVLGFHSREISKFVFRETIILSFIGLIVGIPLGNILHKYIIFTAETDNILFLKSVSILSYLKTAFAIFIFTLIVGLVINKNLKKINMIESLKIAE